MDVVGVEVTINIQLRQSFMCLFLGIKYILETLHTSAKGAPSPEFTTVVREIVLNPHLVQICTQNIS